MIGKFLRIACWRCSRSYTTTTARSPSALKSRTIGSFYGVGAQIETDRQNPSDGASQTNGPLWTTRRSSPSREPHIPIRSHSSICDPRLLTISAPPHRGVGARIENWHATVPTTGASSTDGVGSWAAHVGHRIQHIARELRFDRSPTGCPGSKTIADDRRIPEEGVLDSRLLMVA